MGLVVTQEGVPVHFIIPSKLEVILDFIYFSNIGSLFSRVVVGEIAIREYTKHCIPVISAASSGFYKRF